MEFAFLRLLLTALAVLSTALSALLMIVLRGGSGLIFGVGGLLLAHHGLAEGSAHNRGLIGYITPVNSKTVPPVCTAPGLKR